jgi:hypothetical protein
VLNAAAAGLPAHAKRSRLLTWRAKGTKKEMVKLFLQKGPAAAPMRVSTGAVMGILVAAWLAPSMYWYRRLKPEEAASAYAYASTSVDTQEPDS